MIPTIRSMPLVLATALITAVVMATLLTAGSAHADTPRTAVCKITGAVANQKGADWVQTWMQEQLAAGKTDFMPLANSGLTFGACAW